MSARNHKIVADLLLRWRRTVPTVIGMSLALAGVGAMLITFVLLKRDLDAGFRATAPANVEIEAEADAFPPSTEENLAAIPGVRALDHRARLSLRVELAPGKWVPLILTEVQDFTRLPLGFLTRDSGAWPPPDGTLLIERDGRFLLPDPAAGHLHVRLPGGEERDLPIAGTLADPAEHPSRMEMVIYAYASPATLRGWGASPPHARLLLDAAPEAFQAIETRLRQDGVKLRWFEAEPRAVYGHQFQIDAILALLASVALILGTLSVVLVFDLVNALLTGERRSIGIQRALGATGRQIGGDLLRGIFALSLTASLIALIPALQGGTALAGLVLRQMNFNSPSPSPAWLAPALVAAEIAIPLLIALLRLRPALAVPAREALSRADLAQGAARAERLATLLRRLPPTLRMAGWSLACRPGRAALSALVLSLGLVYFILALDMSASMAETRTALQRQAGFDVAVILREPWSRTDLDTWLNTVPGVVHADYGLLGAARLNGGNSLSLLRVAPDTAALRPDLLAGHWLSADRPHEIVVNQALLKLRPGLRLGELYDLDGETVRLIGVVREFAGPRIYAPISRPGGANLAMASLATHDFASERAAAIRLEGPGVAQVIPARLAEAVVAGHLAPLSGLLGVLGGLALVVGLLGLASSLSVGVAERIREIGVMKAIGASGWTLSLLIAAEALVVAGAGWAVAELAAPLFSREIVAAFGNAVVGIPFDYRSDAYAPWITLAVAAATALAAALPPARAAMRISVRSALRSD